MGIAYNTSVVRSGLTMHLDAANPKSYPGTGTVWTDLSGQGNTGTLVNGAGYSSNNGGSLVFDGVNDYISVTNTGDFSFPGDFAVCVWLYPTAYKLTYQTIIDTYPGGSNNGWIFTTMNNTTQLISWWNPSNGWRSSSASVTLNQWNYLVATRIGTTLKIYKNSVEIASLADSVSMDGGELNIGRGLTDSYGPITGNIPNVLIYKNKGLTAAEIAQNYEALRGRYGV